MVFKLGSRGNEVSQIQQKLISIGFFNGPVTGVFDYGTDAAIRNFQRSEKIGIDGEVGPNTWEKLFNAAMTEPAVEGGPQNKTSELNAIVDLSHHNDDVDLNKAKSDGILGIIQKATQGIRYTDPTYEANLSKAHDASLMWGAYHFGTAGDGVEQAEHFLEVVNPGPKDLLVLDFEANPHGPSMTLEEARAFVTHIYKMTKRWPGFYSGHYIKELLGNKKDSVLSKCWFWLAQYGPTPVVPANWENWALWQYTDGGLGSKPHSVAGIGRCDRDKFNGSEAGLKKFWGVEA